MDINSSYYVSNAQCFFLTIVILFGLHRLLKTANFEKNSLFQKDKQTDGPFFKILNIYRYDPCQLFGSQTLNW